jgi:tetratricopeptide (TPR) repeat protein
MKYAYSLIKPIFSGIFCILLLAACSTNRNTPFSRAYHQFVTRYNIFFNAQQLYDEALANQTRRFRDNYSDLLPIHPFTRIPGKTRRGGPFDAVIEKTETAIRHHSIPSANGDEEHNPFLKNVWLLMGRAHVQNQDYDEALSVFSHIIHLYRNDIDVISEAQLWKMRAYIETHRLCDAGNLANVLRERHLPRRLEPLFVETYAHYLLRQQEYTQALPYLRKLIDFQRNNIQRRRLQFLLGQTLALIGENEKAFRAFEHVKGLRTPYHLALNAVVQQSALVSDAVEQRILHELHRLSRRANSVDFLDKIHFAIGNIYFRQNDTVNAIQHYLLAETERDVMNRERTLAQVALADIYFDRRDFVPAESRYTQAMVALSETSEIFERVAFRSEVLRELVPRLLAVKEQDSLQQLANLSFTEQEKIINLHIAQRRESARMAEREAYLAAQFARAPQLAPLSPSAAESAFNLFGRDSESAFYFHNPQLVAQGRIEFQRRWGNRPLEDNWRTGNRQITLPAHQEDDSDTPPPRTANPHTLDYYLQQLPTTPEALAISNRIIEKNLFEIGYMAKNRLGDMEFAISIFERLLGEFPASAYVEKIREILKKIDTNR